MRGGGGRGTAIVAKIVYDWLRLGLRATDNRCGILWSSAKEDIAEEGTESTEDREDLVDGGSGEGMLRSGVLEDEIGETRGDRDDNGLELTP